jgi:hypothetical protein
MSAKKIKRYSSGNESEKIELKYLKVSGKL